MALAMGPFRWLMLSAAGFCSLCGRYAENDGLTHSVTLVDLGNTFGGAGKRLLKLRLDKIFFADVYLSEIVLQLYPLAVNVAEVAVFNAETEIPDKQYIVKNLPQRLSIVTVASGGRADQLIVCKIIKDLAVTAAYGVVGLVVMQMCAK